MSVNTLWILITNYPKEGYSQQVNLEANLDISQYGEIRQRTFYRRHFIKEPSCSFEGDVTTEY